jgi:hypothetical protein
MGSNGDCGPASLRDAAIDDDIDDDDSVEDSSDVAAGADAEGVWSPDIEQSFQVRDKSFSCCCFVVYCYTHRHPSPSLTHHRHHHNNHLTVATGGTGHLPTMWTSKDNPFRRGKDVW